MNLQVDFYIKLILLKLKIDFYFYNKFNIEVLGVTLKVHILQKVSPI